MVLKFTLCNNLVADYFDYLLLILFDNEFVIEKCILDFISSEIYRIIYYFDAMCDLILDGKQQILLVSLMFGLVLNELNNLVDEGQW